MINNLNDSEAVRRKKEIRKLATAANLGDSSVTTPGKRIRVGAPGAGGYLEAGGRLFWQGPVLLDGDVTITLTLEVTGDTTIGGTLGVTADSTFSNDLHIGGDTTITGTTELQSDLNITGGGKIVAGGLTIDPTGGFGGQIIAGGSGVVYINATSLTAGTDLSVLRDLRVFRDAFITGDQVVGGAKSFRMPHPMVDGKWLQHGSTESPVSGVEYWGDSVVDESGSVAIELPDYFDALTKPEGRTVFVTGRGVLLDWTDIEGNDFTVSGEPGAKFSWLVKAERFGGDFAVVSDRPPESEPGYPPLEEIA